MSRSLTTLVDLKFNYPALNLRYLIYRVSLDKKNGKQDYAGQLSFIDREVSPQALIRHSGYYWILVDIDKKVSSTSAKVSFEQVKFEDCDTLSLGRLLIRALGKVAPDEFFSGLGETYLFVEPDKFFEHIVYKCLKFDLMESVRFDSLFIDMAGVTFSPIEAVYKAKYQIDKAPKFEFQNSTGLLRRNPKGNLMVYSPGNKKFTTYAIDISGQKPISLLKTKTGAIYQFVKLMNKHFCDVLELKLKPIEADWREHYQKKDIEKVYRKIYDVIDLAGGCQVVNASMHSNGFERLKAEQCPVKVEFVDGDIFDKTKPTLVVLDPAKEYEGAGKVDPKQSYYSKDTAVQSVYNSTIISQRPNKNGTELQPLIDTWVKELAIKQECLHGQFSIQEFVEGYWFVELDKKTFSYHVLKCEEGHFKYEEHDEYYFDELNIVLPEKQRFFETLQYVIDMSGDEPQVCTIVHEGIAVIPDADKLFAVLERLERSDNQGMSREYIDGYLSSLGRSDDPIVDKLLIMLERAPFKTEFYKEDLKLAKIGYRSNAEKALVNDYFDQTGIMFNYSLKGEHNEYLEALTGHFYDAEHSAYFVGSEKGGFKFSRGQFNHIRYLEGPDCLKQKCLELTKSYFIRNKLATVRPFPFKYLAQCKDNQKWHS
ncbi:hypothetical protein [Shewanella nanhaiensis]|uniref:Uncharacterized protein n=1 Tax=Shewanella nanhaiensis TaxID=2864872 RepID=A0ABS7E927_9GAMM|nr:hypothetical protein [Shewanella nanhaiensis]MBW8186194.1 hypothetical protein [Shewanella nanhaiensis]